MTKVIFTLIFALCGILPLFADGILYVNNLTGSDSNPGTKDKPFASIEKGIASLRQSGRLEVANTGKPYTRPYPGVRGVGLYIHASGTPEKPVVINGNGAVFSGLSVIPADKWKADGGNIYSLPFWPMSNMMKGYTKENFWHDGTQIWFVDGKAAKNCHNADELAKTPGGFWWDKAKQTVRFHLPQGKKLADVKIQLPANFGFYILGAYVRVENFIVIHSWNDGFDTAKNSLHAHYRNCISMDNCGQGFSTHELGDVLYEDCAAVRNSSSGICNVNWSQAKYLRCVIADNNFEAGVYIHNNSMAVFDRCIISNNRPFEQIWQRQNSTIFFNNCLIEGLVDRSIMTLANGIVSLRNCNIFGGSDVAAMSNSFTGELQVDNCLIKGQKKYHFLVPNASRNRLFMCGNSYTDSPGIQAVGRLFTAATANEWLALKCDRESIFTAPEAGKKYLDRSKIRTTIGANIPASVYQLRDKVVNAVSTPDGVIWGKSK